jgi:hypothetical protein
MRTTAITVILSLLTLSAGNVFAQEADQWRRVAEAIPLGSKVKVQTLDGKRVTGTLMGVDATGLMVKKATRLPEPAFTLTFDRVSSIEKDNGGLHIGKAIAVGVATGAGMILTMILFAMQLD